MKRKWKFSTSFINSLKRCPFDCYLKYVLGLVPIEDTDSQRQGTNWHEILRIMHLQPEPGLTHLDMAVKFLNEAYSTVPLSKTREEWLVEQAVLLYSLSGYNWLYSEDDYKVIATEIPFSLPVRNPVTGRALPNIVLDGRIDKLVQSPNGIYCIDEHKSTSKPINDDSSFWNHLNLDTQTTLYPYAAQQLQLSGQLEQFGIKATDPLIATVRYDVWHKPGISPKKLTQAESAQFEKDGLYFDEKFNIGGQKTEGGKLYLMVNGEPAEMFAGKKEGTFAIRETPDMFGIRLLNDISERPDFYFARRELDRTADDLKRFEKELYSIYKTVKFMEKYDAFWKNEQQCEATFRCPYTNLCYNNVDVLSEQVPEGFKRLKFAEKENG